MPHGIRETIGWVLCLALLLVLVSAVDRRIRNHLLGWGDDLVHLRWIEPLTGWGDALFDVMRGQGIEGGWWSVFLWSRCS